LSCIGWVRYLRERGLTDQVMLKRRDKTLFEAIKITPPALLVPMFEEFERMCKDMKFGKKGNRNAVREYKQFDPPGLLPLFPRCPDEN